MTSNPFLTLVFHYANIIIQHKLDNDYAMVLWDRLILLCCAKHNVRKSHVGNIFVEDQSVSHLDREPQTLCFIQVKMIPD